MDDETDHLNECAFWALRGAFSAAEGQIAIAALLRSGRAIDPLVLEELAQALDPIGRRASSVRLKMTNLEQGHTARQLRKRRQRLVRGDRGLAELDSGKGWKEAIEAAAEKERCSPETIEKDVAYTRSYQVWCDRFDGERTDTNPAYHLWRAMFHHADINGETPDEVLARSNGRNPDREATSRKRSP